MFFRQLHLTTALRPSLADDEALLFVQDGVGLYEGKFKIPNHQNGHVYLTSHRVCYVDNDEPRKYSVGIDLKEIERAEFYAGFLKSSAKVTLVSKPSRDSQQFVQSPVPNRVSVAGPWTSGTPSPAPAIAPPPPPPPRDLNATWICSICGLSNPVPSNFDPAMANQHTPLPPCLACGVKPPLVVMVKATIAAMSNRPAAESNPSLSNTSGQPTNGVTPLEGSVPVSRNRCPRCTFQNHPSLSSCEMCGAAIQTGLDRRQRALMDPTLQRTDSPGPMLKLNGSIVGSESIESMRLSFRAGGEKTFMERLKGALVQRKWLLHSAPPVPKPMTTTPQNSGTTPITPGFPNSTSSPQRIVGIAGLEKRGAELRQNNQAVIGSAFEDLEALMTSAKEVIQMAEQFARQTNNGSADSDARQILSDSASALGLMTTKDMLGSGSAAEQLYVTELARDLAEFLTDDRKGTLRKEGGIISLVDLWQVFNRTRNGIELISPLDFQKAAEMWETLNLPIRLRRFRSGLLVVQERGRTDEKTVRSLVAWLRGAPNAAPGDSGSLEMPFGRGVTAQETAERFGWSVGVAVEELDMAEELGALCRDQCLDGTRFWENQFSRFVLVPIA